MHGDESGRIVEYQVVDMKGKAKSGIYSTSERGPDAWFGVLSIVKARGGQIMRREIDIGPWLPVNKVALGDLDYDDS